MRQAQCQQWETDSCFTFAKNRVLTYKTKSRMTSIKARLNRSRLGGDDMCPLVIQVIRNRKKRELYTPYRLKVSDFDAKNERAVTAGRSKKRIDEIREINQYLIYIKEEFEQVRISLEEQGTDYSADDVIRCYKNRNDMSRFFIYAGCLTDKLADLGRNGTAANYTAAVNAFARFLGNRELSMNDLTKKTVQDFMDFQSKQGNSPNTVAFYVKQLRAIYNKADDEGYVHAAVHPFHNVRLKGEKTPKRAISGKEISRINELDLKGKHRHLELARDLFMFSLYSRGMAFVDMCYLRRENIRGNMLVYQRRKTGQWLQIKIEPPLKALLRKYANEKSVYLLPMLRKDDSYEQYRYIQRRLNKRMRQIGGMLNFDFPLTFYVARHTWATSAYENGIAMSVISESMGHTSEKTTRIYLTDLSHRIIDNANRKVISCWNLHTRQ